MAEAWVYAIVLVVLVGFNVVQFCLYSKNLQTLVDKLMSRDLADYKRSISPKTKSTSPRIETDLFEEKPPEGLMF